MEEWRLENELWARQEHFHPTSSDAKEFEMFRSRLWLGVGGESFGLG